MFDFKIKFIFKLGILGYSIFISRFITESFGMTVDYYYPVTSILAFIVFTFYNIILDALFNDVNR